MAGHTVINHHDIGWSGKCRITVVPFLLDPFSLIVRRINEIAVGVTVNTVDKLIIIGNVVSVCPVFRSGGGILTMVRYCVELVRVAGLREARRQVGAAVVAGIGIIGVVDHHLLRGHGAAVDAQVFHIAGEIGVAVVVAGAPLVAGVPAGTADVVVLIGADLVQEIIQIPLAATFSVVGVVLYAVDPVGDGAACDPDDHVVDLAGFKRGRARGCRFDVL